MGDLSTIRYPVERIPDFVRRVLDALAPHEVYLVGGTPRDFLLGASDSGASDRTDWDLSTVARPETVLALLEQAGIRGVPTGMDHGTVTAVDAGAHAEITTFRRDIDCDGRHAVVEFADRLEEDLARRDFTVNSLAIDPRDGRILDPFSGIADLTARVIRTVGDPRERFREDRLRLLRAVRFAVRIGGTLEPSTWEALCAMAGGIREVSPERVRDELMKMLGYPSVAHGFELLHESGLLATVLPEFDACFGVDQNRYHADDVARHTLHVVDALHPRDPLLRWTALMHDIGKPQSKQWLDDKDDYVFYGHDALGARMTEDIMRRLRFPNDATDFCVALVQHHMFNIHPDMTPSGVRRLLRRVGPEKIRPMLRLRIADRKGNRRHRGFEPGLMELVRKIRRVEQARDALSVRDLAISGKDLIAMGFVPGPRFGETLNALLERVLDEPELNERTRLLGLAREMLRGTGQAAPGF